MSLAYIDTIPSIQKNFKAFEGLSGDLNTHIGFTNLCSPLLLEKNEWHYHKAAKPQSGAIGKLTSEIILLFTEILFDDIVSVKSIGGVGLADAVLHHRDGRTILCEIKASPLTTYPFLFSVDPSLLGNLNSLTRTQVGSISSALHLHTPNVVQLGKPSDHLWPFKAAVDYIVSPNRSGEVEEYVTEWARVREAYKTKNREDPLYYAANASGHPPKIAKDEFDWPKGQSVSDSKTSAGFDRTDDIKKGVYQTFKLGIEASLQFPDEEIKTAIISNLPAYRHGEGYVDPFKKVFWGHESSFEQELEGIYSCKEKDLKRPFDYVIALDEAFTRGNLL
ncbi:hypothetical protein N9891_01770 [bacterium]|nr:hypothetical protein [bacterium]